MTGADDRCFSDRHTANGRRRWRRTPPERAVAAAGDAVVDVPNSDADRARRTIAAVWRIESARIVATLTRFVGDVGQAEDLAQEALVEALKQWPD